MLQRQDRGRGCIYGHANIPKLNPRYEPYLNPKQERFRDRIEDVDAFMDTREFPKALRDTVPLSLSLSLSLSLLCLP